jgi:long-subunit fatty acid transport protein
MALNDARFRSRARRAEGASSRAPSRSTLSRLIPLLVLLAPATAAATAAGTIFSGPTTADVSSIYWNPGAMTGISGTMLTGFGGISVIRGQYWRETPIPSSGQPYPRADLFVIKPDPVLGVVTSAGLRRWRFGLGIAAPLIDGASWQPTCGGKPASTRYYAIDGRLVQIYIEPAVAFRVHRVLSVGVGLDITATWVQQTLITDFAARINQLACSGLGAPASSCQTNAPLVREDPLYDAPTELGGVGWGVGVYAGALFSPRPWLQIGAAFHSGPGHVSVPVTMEVKLPKPVTDFVEQSLPTVKLPELRAEGSVEVSSPWILTGGIRVLPTARLELAADVQWMNKSELTTLVGNIHRSSSELISGQVLVKASRDDILCGVRGAYQLREDLRLALRVEFGRNTRPERYTTPVSLDMDKISLHLGGSWQATRRIAFFLEYAHYFIFEREIRETNFAPNAAPTTPEEEGFDRPSPTGTYRAQTDRVGLGISVTF